MTEAGAYPIPEGQLSLAGPVARPAVGTVPIRGDLAHIDWSDLPGVRPITASFGLAVMPDDGTTAHALLLAAATALCFWSPRLRAGPPDLPDRDETPSRETPPASQPGPEGNR